MKVKYEFPQMKYNEQKGLVSIIVPIYNTEEIYLRECLDSILSQTFKNWEAILVNDGSTNKNTLKIIDEYIKKDSRFIAIHKQNQGTLLARKTGLENSKGEFIANIDHDDTYNLQFLEKMHAKITETNADFVLCNFIYNINFCSNSYFKWNADAYENVIAMFVEQGVSCITWDKLIKREIYAKVLFPNINIIYNEDPIQILQVTYHSKLAVFVPENLYLHIGGGSSKQLRKENFTSCIQATICIKEILEILFNGAVPQNVKKASYYLMNPSYSFFSLSKEERLAFEDELKQFLPEYIKHNRILRLKFLCFLANKGIEFPLKFYNWMKNKL